MFKRISIIAISILLFASVTFGASSVYVVKNDGTIVYTKYATINAAVTAQSSNKVTLVVPSPETLAESITFPSTLTLYIPYGGMIVRASTYTAAINGPLKLNGDGVYQIFSGFPTGVTFGAGVVKEVHPQWWYSTDYAAAINSAIASIKNIGGKIKFTHSTDLTSPINATCIINDLIFEGNSTGSAAGTDTGVLLTIKHTGVGFDCTGSAGLTFKDFRIKGDPTITPTVGFLLARDVSGDSSGKHRFFNIKSSYTSKFSIAVIYSFGSEENDYYSLELNNCYAGGKLFYSTAYNNIHPVTSTFQTILPGLTSNSVTNIYGGSFINRGGVTSDIFYFDRVDDFKVFGGFWFNAAAAANGRSYVYVDTTNGASNHILMTGIRGEPGTFVPEYGFYFSNDAARTPTGWSILDSKFQCNTNVVYSSDNTILDNFNYHRIADVTNSGISAKIVQYCHIESPIFVNRASGYLSHSTFLGNILTGYTIVDSVFCTFYDKEYNAKWMTKGYVGGHYNGPLDTVTLTPNAGSTTVENHVVTGNSLIFLFPTSANAAADVGSATGVYISAKTTATSFVITHPNNANADKTFNYLILN